MTRLRVATFLAPNMYPVYDYIVRTLGARLGLAAELYVGASFDEFARGEADAGFL